MHAHIGLSNRAHRKPEDRLGLTRRRTVIASGHETMAIAGTALVTEGNPSIAVFSAYYPSHGGGMELASRDLASVLSSAGMHVEWAAQGEAYLGEEPNLHCTP